MIYLSFQDTENIFNYGYWNSIDNFRHIANALAHVKQHFDAVRLWRVLKEKLDLEPQDKISYSLSLIAIEDYNSAILELYPK